MQALAAEYFAGASAAEGRSRTIFMVGDFKQAIFGFQGTDPQEFENARGLGAAAVGGLAPRG